MREINKQIINDMMYNLPESKIIALDNACRRNGMLTSEYGLPHLTFTVYKEGFLIQLEGTRSQFNVYAADNDGELVITRKPPESKLHKLYSEWDYTYNIVDIIDVVNESGINS